MLPLTLQNALPIHRCGRWGAHDLFQNQVGQGYLEGVSLPERLMLSESAEKEPYEKRLPLQSHPPASTSTEGLSSSVRSISTGILGEAIPAEALVSFLLGMLT